MGLLEGSRRSHWLCRFMAGCVYSARSHRTSKLVQAVRGSNSVGRVSAFQAECRRFESGLPLHTKPMESRKTATRTSGPSAVPRKWVPNGYRVYFMRSKPAQFEYSPQSKPATLAGQSCATLAMPHAATNRVRDSRGGYVRSCVVAFLRRSTGRSSRRRSRSARRIILRRRSTADW